MMAATVEWRTLAQERPEADERTARFEVLLRTDYARIHRLAQRFGIPASDAEDAAQEVFARAWNAWPKFRGDSAPETWLTRIAVNYFASRRADWARRFKGWMHLPRETD